MTQSQLIQHFFAPDRKITVAKLGHQLKRENFSLRELVDLTFHPDKDIALKSSKLLVYILFKFPENYYNDLEYFIGCAEDVTTPAGRKPYAKILMHITSPEVSREVRHKMKEINLERVIELCFEWMIDPKMPVSVRASAGEALFNMRHRYPWIAEELSKQLEFMTRSASPVLLAKCNYILSYLHPED
ncbi:MAG: hypothetical protein JWQ66_750 [Mucilaginibacter sp.]|nr:hypothetical protein [Mucilaginibacter sp.]